MCPDTGNEEDAYRYSCWPPEQVGWAVKSGHTRGGQTQTQREVYDSFMNTFACSYRNYTMTANPQIPTQREVYDSFQRNRVAGAFWRELYQGEWPVSKSAYKEVKNGSKVFRVLGRQGDDCTRPVLGTYASKELAECARRDIHAIHEDCGYGYFEIEEIEIVTGIIEKPTYEAVKTGILWTIYNGHGDIIANIQRTNFKTDLECELMAMRVRDLFRKREEEH